jgi:hypothetical protein
MTLWMHKKRPLYAPMLGTLGGGSARGFGRGKSKPNFLLSWNESSSFAERMNFNFAPSASTGWGYNSGLSDYIRITSDQDWYCFGWGSGRSGGSGFTCHIFETNGTSLYSEAFTHPSGGGFFDHEFSGPVPLLSAGVSYDFEQECTYASGNSSSYMTNGNASVTQATEGVTMQLTRNSNGQSHTGKGSNGTGVISGQIFWVYGYPASVYGP